MGHSRDSGRLWSFFRGDLLNRCNIQVQYISHYFYRRPSVFKYVSLLQSSHFGTLNNLGKYIYFAFALRKQLTNDNWTFNLLLLYSYESFLFFVHFLYIHVLILSYNMCLYCKMYVRWWTVMYKSQIKDYLSICCHGLYLSSRPYGYTVARTQCYLADCPFSVLRPIFEQFVDVAVYKY